MSLRYARSGFVRGTESQERPVPNARQLRHKRRPRGRWLVLAAVVLGGAAGLGVALSRPAQATSSLERVSGNKHASLVMPVHTHREDRRGAAGRSPR